MKMTAARPPIDKNEDYKIHENKTRIVVILTAVTMVAEIFFGYWTNSMALLVDGYHMASHVLALGLSWIAYILARRYAQTERTSFNKEKLLALSGFTGAIILQVVAVVMAIQATGRLLNPLTIRFSEAIYVAAIGFIVNIVSAIILYHRHENHEDNDHNLRSAYLHVLADGFTSITAIVALTTGMFFNLYFLDAISGLISSVVISKWAVELIISSGKELVEFNRKK
jgi:cation diffusion facilitator family transporter